MWNLYMLRFSTIALALNMFVVACSEDSSITDTTTDTPSEPSVTNQLIPMNVGNNWTYHITIDRETYVTTESILRKEIVPADLRIFVDNEWITRPYGDVWFYSADGVGGYAAVDTAVFRARLNNDRLTLYQTLPNTPQGGFSELLSGALIDVLATWKSERADIGTQAGLFRNCWVICEGTSTYHYWAPGVGLVYRVDSLADGSVTYRKELVHYNIGD